MIGAALDLIDNVLERVIPDPAAKAEAKQKLAELNQKGDLAELNAMVELSKGQQQINQAEAASDGWYKGGWRPAIGYILAICLAYQFLINPLLQWYIAFAGLDITPPAVGLDENLWELMFGMLGLAGWRSLDKNSRDKRKRP